MGILKVPTQPIFLFSGASVLLKSTYSKKTKPDILKTELHNV